MHYAPIIQWEGLFADPAPISSGKDKAVTEVDFDNDLGKTGSLPMRRAFSVTLAIE